MSELEPALKELLAGINALSVPKRRQLRQMLDDSNALARLVAPRQVAALAPEAEIAREAGWIEHNREKYAGQWVALDVDRLITSGSSAKIVLAAAIAADRKDASIVK